MDNGELREKLRQFVAERDWEQFHTPENLAKSISIEAAELLECFQWGQDAQSERIQEELADVVTYCLLLADKLDLNVNQIVAEKLKQTIAKYPIDKAKGKNDKYDRL